MAEASTWNAGTIIWCLFGILLAYGLLAALCEAVWDCLSRTADRFPERKSLEEVPSAEILHDTVESDDFAWDDAYTASFSGDPVEGSGHTDPELLSPGQTPEAGPCADCGGRMLPVVYGYPSAETWRAYEAGLILLGGCEPKSTRTACPRCRVGEGERPVPWRGGARTHA